MAAEPTSDDIAYVTALVRDVDRPRYYATLFAPAALRADLFALYGFAAEVARVPDQVSEPGLGEIRLRWWRDALAQATEHQGGGSAPALRAVAGTIARHRLPLAPFDALIEARSADLYSDPPASRADVEGRMGETESALFQMAAIIFGAAGPETAEAAGHAGIAYGIARGLAEFASARARGRTILSADILAAEGLTSADVFATERRTELAAAVGQLAELARRHLGLGRFATTNLARQFRPAFLPLAPVGPLLNRVERLGAAIAERNAHLSDFESLLRIAIARLR